VSSLTFEQYERVLDLLVRVAEALASSPTADDSLPRIVGLCAEKMGGLWTLEVMIEGESSSIQFGTEPSDAGFPMREPLRAPSGDLGRLTWLRNGSDEQGPGDHQLLRLLALELTASLSGRAATLRERRIADRLQRALLPDHLPAVEGCRFSAAYRPASDEAEVGGDWYDAFTLPDGRVAISVGDVAGHGLGAAAIMGELRQAMRTAAVAASKPSEVLERVNGAVRLRDSIAMVTAVFAFYDARTSVFSYAVAGHPPPILAMPGRFARVLPLGGIPLGCSSAVNSPDWTFTLPEGSLLALYTDGLIENERDLERGERQLVAAVRAVSGEPGDDYAEAIQNRVFDGGGNRDDAAVLTLSRNAPVPGYVFSAVATVAPLARAILERELTPFRYDEDKRFGVLVAAGEAIANAVEHAYRDEAPGLIRLSIEREEGALLITVEDFGRWRSFVKRDERGRGIDLMRAFSDGVQIKSRQDSTSVVLRVDLPA
jgi:serine phosphatase RsbU (regulator of sigma subunit)/anti-sigma regulatory factor (Ser/Thr protein kinase)